MVTLPEAFNVAAYFVDRKVVEERGEKIAIECGDQRISYRQLFEQINRIGNVLRRLEVRSGQRVLLLLLDSPEFLYCFFGVIKIGAVAVPVNTLLKPPDYEYLLNDTQAEVAVVHEALLGDLKQIPSERLPCLRKIVIAGGEQHAERPSLAQLMQSASPELEPAATHRDDAAFWLYSSGSTGAAKACIHLHHDMVVSSQSYAREILQMNASDRCYSVARLFFAYGLGNAGYFPLYCGATTILSPALPTPASVFADVERYRPTLFFSVPSNYAALLSHHREDGKEFDFSSVRHAISAGEALPAPLFERFKQRFGVEILDAWGSTETLHMVISNRPGEVKPGSSGKIIPGFGARIVDEDGRLAPSGEIGALMVKADSTCIGYWNQDQKTQDAFAGPWFRTGDKYFRDDAGYFWHAGRTDDLFKVNGRWLNPIEIESALLAHPAVREAAVVARKDANGLIKPAAYVVLNSSNRSHGELVNDLQEWVAEKHGHYKRPRWIEFLAELPKTATGKLQRFKLRALAEAASASSPRRREE